MNESCTDDGFLQPSLLARRKSLFWRIHFWSALLVSPFILIATLTGILYIFTPQIEAVLYEQLDHVVPSGAMRSLDDAVAAARVAVPSEWELRSVNPAYHMGDTVKVNFSPRAARPAKWSEHSGHIHSEATSTRSSSRPIAAQSTPIVVYVNPYSAQVIGQQASDARWGNWAKKLHSRLLQSEGWRWMIELAATSMMVMLLTGMYLWWPRANQKALPQKGAQGRRAWRQWHSFVGVVFTVMSIIVLTTGLTWSKYAGDQIRTLRNLTGQAPPKAPQTLTSTARTGSTPLTWQAAWDIASRQAPDVSMQLSPPQDVLGTWRVNATDPSQPKKRFELILDGYTGQTLYFAGWDQQTAFAKATAIGIPFHRGEFGGWNQALLLMFGLSVLFSLVTGWVMFIKRRPAGLFGLPRLLPGTWQSAPAGMWISAVLLCLLMPLMALLGLLVMLLEVMLSRTDNHD